MSDLLPWQARVVQEAKDLSVKLTALEKFNLCLEGMNEYEKNDLNLQAVYMRKYLDILNNRIRRFED